MSTEQSPAETQPSTPPSDDQTVTLHHGDLFDELQKLDDESVHAVVTDPPYGLNFMPEATNGWDDFDPKEYQEFCQDWAEEVKRVLKPGGHLIAFSGSRTHHRLNTGVEDAGFNIRDQIVWHYGSGFPKGSDVGKYIDRYYDAEDEREVIRENPNSRENKSSNVDMGQGSYDPITKPATTEAERWTGWRSQLKPASEFAVLAQKPKSESAIYRNCLEHGVGALNIDACRVPTDESWEGQDMPEADCSNVLEGGQDGSLNRQSSGSHEDGRYPSNLVLSPQAARLIDEQSGVSVSTGGQDGSAFKTEDGMFTNGDAERFDRDPGYGDQGGASRYFPRVDSPTRFRYESKASKSERTHDGSVDNPHPTVKPTDLLSWLVRLVTREGQTVLDPFAGSGSTALAAVEENVDAVLVEREDEYVDIIRDRLDAEDVAYNVE